MESAPRFRNAAMASPGHSSSSSAHASSSHAATCLLAAEPGPIELTWTANQLVVLDMQRDFLEPGGFGETLGNDVSQLSRAIKPCAAVLAAARETGMLVVHTREGHLPDLSDEPPAQIERGGP